MHGNVHLVSHAHLHHRRRASALYHKDSATADSVNEATPAPAPANGTAAPAAAADSGDVKGAPTTAPRRTVTVRRNKRWGPAYINLPPRSVFSSLYQLLVDLPALQSIAIMGGMAGALTLAFGLAYAYLLPSSFVPADGSNASSLSTADFFLYSLGITTTLGEAACVPTRGRLGLAVANFQAVIVQLLLVFITGVVFHRLSKPGLHMTLCRALMFQDPNEHLGKCLTTRLLFDDPADELIDVRITLTYVRRLTPTFVKSSLLKLVREDVPLLRVGTTVAHALDDEDEPSPLAGETLETLKKRGALFVLTVTGTERSTMQTVVFTKTYNLPKDSSSVGDPAATGDDDEGVVLDGTKFKLKDNTEQVPGVAASVLNFDNLHKVVPLNEYKAQRFFRRSSLESIETK